MFRLPNILITLSLEEAGETIQGCWRCPVKAIGCKVYFWERNFFRFNYGNCECVDDAILMNEKNTRIALEQKTFE